MLLQDADVVSVVKDPRATPVSECQMLHVIGDIPRLSRLYVGVALLKFESFCALDV